MEATVVDKIVENINKEYINKFPLSVMKDELFLPISRQNEIIYVVIVDSDNKDKRNAILTKIALNTKLKPKTIPVTKKQFDEIIDHCSKEKMFVTRHSNNVIIDPSQISAPAPQATSEQQTDDTQQPPVAKPPERKRLGEQLIDDGLITQEQLTAALAESKESKIPVGSALVKLNFITIDQLRATLSKQQGIAHVDDKNLKIELSVIRLLPEDFIKHKMVVPISTDGKSIVVGMVNPNDKQALNDIIYLTGLSPFPLILTHIEFEKCIKNFFETKRETEKLMEEITLDDDANVVDQSLWDHVEKELEDESSVVAKLVNSIIEEAIDKNVSDIHIEPRTGKYLVRYRIDGILRVALEVPTKVEASLVSRLKVISRMDIAEHRRSQDGNFILKYKGKPYTMRVNTLPVGAKEKICIRILKPNLKATDEEKRIELVGATKQDIEKINILTTSPHGIILTAGPTGSGKTTTLYSILNKINSEMVNITTVEDPIEIKLEGINQVQVNTKADITFALCMRAILRQDPDVIMVGEIRDFETLEASIHAALTGHLVFSTIHTNSAAATVTRLNEMGAENHLIASALIGVISQRLVRRLCTHCKEAYEPSINDLKLIISQPEDFEVFQGNKIYRHKGCDRCDNTGFVGRLGLYEVLGINREIKKLIAQGNSAIEIEEAAVGCGMKTLQRSGLDAILAGETTISEFIRVLGVVND